MKWVLGFRLFAKSLRSVIGVVIIWRGIWYVLDALDLIMFGGSHFWTAVVGIVLGLLILYVPDGDLDELSKH
ncbi:MAG: hypothetical protein ACOYBJ_03020 [Patescibacteria group bacterium]|jgi:hypothetical protein